MRLKLILLGCGLICIGLTIRAEDEGAAASPPRLANGTVVEGTVSEATSEGLLVQTPKGDKTIPWKYLSTGTRYRYERPMLEKIAAEKAAAEKAAAAKAAEAKAKAEAEKIAAAKATATNTPAGATNVPAATNLPAPVSVAPAAATNAPAVVTSAQPAAGPAAAKTASAAALTGEVAGAATSNQTATNLPSATKHKEKASKLKKKKKGGQVQDED